MVGRYTYKLPVTHLIYSVCSTIHLRISLVFPNSLSCCETNKSSTHSENLKARKALTELVCL